MRAFTTLCLTLLCALPVLAQNASGPEPGARVEPLKVQALTGAQEGKELDYAADRKEKPTLYVFVREFDRPIARYLKFLDQAVKEESGEALTVAVWLTEKKDETRQYLPRVQQSLQFQSTALTLFPGDVNGPDGWNLNPNVRVTTVLAKDGKVVRSWGYVALNDTDVPAVRESLKKALGK